MIVSFCLFCLFETTETEGAKQAFGERDQTTRTVKTEHVIFVVVFIKGVQLQPLGCFDLVFVRAAQNTQIAQMHHCLYFRTHFLLSGTSITCHK